MWICGRDVYRSRPRARDFEGRAIIIIIITLILRSGTTVLASAEGGPPEETKIINVRVFAGASEKWRTTTFSLWVRKPRGLVSGFNAAFWRCTTDQHVFRRRVFWNRFSVTRTTVSMMSRLSDIDLQNSKNKRWVKFTNVDFFKVFPFKILLVGSSQVWLLNPLPRR